MIVTENAPGRRKRVSVCAGGCRRVFPVVAPEFVSYSVSQLVDRELAAHRPDLSSVRSMARQLR